MLAHRLLAVEPGLAAEAAVHRDAEVVEVARRRLVPPPHAGHAVDRQHDAQEDAGVADVQVAQRREEALVLAAQIARPGQVQPVDRPARLGDRVVGHAHDHAHVLGLVHRPLRERAVTEVVADEHLLGDQPGQPRDRAGEALPGAVARPREHALDVLRLVGDVPLDREVRGRDRLAAAARARGHEVLEARRGHRVVAGEVGLERVQRARRERQPDLEAQPGRDRALVAQRGGTPRRRRSRRRCAASLPVQRVDARPAPRRPASRRRGAGCPSATRSPRPRRRRGSAARAARARSRPTPGAARSRRRAGRRRGRRSARRPARNAASVESAGRLPTSSRWLVTRPLMIGPGA